METAAEHRSYSSYSLAPGLKAESMGLRLFQAVIMAFPAEEGEIFATLYCKICVLCSVTS